MPNSKQSRNSANPNNPSTSHANHFPTQVTVGQTNNKSMLPFQNDINQHENFILQNNGTVPFQNNLKEHVNFIWKMYSFCFWYIFEPSDGNVCLGIEAVLWSGTIAVENEAGQSKLTPAAVEVKVRHLVIRKMNQMQSVHSY